MIYTVTLNPAIDKVIYLDQLNLKKTNRIDKCIETLGGKGTHVSVNLSLMGITNTALGVTFGENGRKIQNMLSMLGVNVNFLHYDEAGKNSRTNYEIVESNGPVCTMLTERGEILPVQITDALVTTLREILHEKDVLVLTGDARNVEDITIYSKLIREAQGKDALVFLDASGDYLKEGIKNKPYLIKPNLEELCCLAGKELLTETDVITAIIELDPDIQIVAMTWGDKGAVVRCAGELFRIFPLALDVKNEAGCGDAFLSGIIAGINKNLSIIETLKLAAGISGATAENELTVGFDTQRAEELNRQVNVKKLLRSVEND